MSANIREVLQNDGYCVVFFSLSPVEN